jgi:zinc and cadmium transporter
LLYNVLSALTFLVGGLVTYTLSAEIDVSFLLPFAAGNFLYIGASDLVPEVNKHESAAANAVHLGAYVLGVSLMAAIAHGGH